LQELAATFLTLQAAREKDVFDARVFGSISVSPKRNHDYWGITQLRDKKIKLTGTFANEKTLVI